MSISKKFVIIDEIMDMLEAAKSGVVPGSVSQAVVSGIQNVPSQIIQRTIDGGAGGCYTTFPLSPIVKNCCIDESYLNMEFDINYLLEVELAENAATGETYIIPYHIGLRDNASMFNQLQILIENTSLWSTVYHREESVVAYNALPETEIRGNNQYASIEKMQKCIKSPMKRFVATFTGVDSGAKTGSGNINKNSKTGSLDVTHHFKCTVDLNRLTPLLSNLHFTTPHMGNLRIKPFLQDFANCMFFCPDYGYYAFIPGNAVTSTVPCACTDNTKTNIDTAVNATIAGLQAPGTAQPIQNQYWSFYPFKKFAKKEITAAEIPFWYMDSVRGFQVAAKITFNDPRDTTANPFMTFAASDCIAEIVQKNFEIKGEEYDRLTNYFASTGSVIIPTQTWSTSVFNNNPITQGKDFPSSMVANVGGYNINFVTMFFHPDDQTTYFSNEYLTQFQMILDGRPINAIRYDYMNDKCIVDMTQAIIDTDHEEINQDYMNSLTFLNEEDNQKYMKSSAHATYGSGGINSSIRRASLRNPASCMYNFSTNLPDAFHSGACILENSNRQAVIRVVGSSALDNSSALGTDNTLFPAFYNHTTDNISAGFTCFCDACIVLNYDAARNKCYDGQLSWAAPFVN